MNITLFIKKDFAGMVNGDSILSHPGGAHYNHRCPYKMDQEEAAPKSKRMQRNSREKKTMGSFHRIPEGIHPANTSILAL
jgi:ABC-type dipeptide/oligopeptide/nickel transport system ATPase component